MILSLQNGQTAVYWACDNGHDEIVRVLLAAKATVNTPDKVGFVVQTHFLQPACCLHCFPPMYSGDRLLFGQPVSMVTRNVWSS